MAKLTLQFSEFHLGKIFFEGSIRRAPLGNQSQRMVTPTYLGPASEIAAFIVFQKRAGGTVKISFA